MLVVQSLSGSHGVALLNDEHNYTELFVFGDGKMSSNMSNDDDAVANVDYAYRQCGEKCINSHFLTYE